MREDIPAPGSRSLGVICGLAAALIWGGFPVATRFGVSEALTPEDVVFLRFAVSGAILAPVLMRIGWGDLGWRPAALMVAGLGFPYMLAVAWGMARGSAGLFAAVTPGSMIAFSVLIGAVWFGSLPARRGLWGLALIAPGLALAGWRAAGAQGSGAAAGLFLLAGLLWAIYTVASKASAVDPLRAAAVTAVVSAALYAPIYFAGRGLALLEAPPEQVLIQGFYQGVMVSVLALWLYGKAVAILGVTAGAAFAALVPGLATLEAAFLLGERPEPLSLAALALVSLGMILIVRAPSR